MRPTAFRSRLSFGLGQTERARRTGGARVREAEPGSENAWPVPSWGIRWGVPRGARGIARALTSTPSAASRSWSSRSRLSAELTSQRGSAVQVCGMGARRPSSPTVRTATQNGNGWPRLIENKGTLRQREGNHVVSELGAELAVPAGRDHDVLPPADAVRHRSGLPAGGQLVLPELAPGVRIERPQVIVHRRRGEHEASGGGDGAAEVRAAAVEQRGSEEPHEQPLEVA